MKYNIERPMSVVEDTVVSLRRIASLCAVMMSVGDSHTNIPPEEVAQVMNHLWLCLDEQIKALDGIEWYPEKTVVA